MYEMTSDKWTPWIFMLIGFMLGIFITTQVFRPASRSPAVVYASEFELADGGTIGLVFSRRPSEAPALGELIHLRPNEPMPPAPPGTRWWPNLQLQPPTLFQFVLEAYPYKLGDVVQGGEPPTPPGTRWVPAGAGLKFRLELKAEK